MKFNMKSGVLTVLNKEFARFFGDKRMVVMTLLLPGILIYSVYSFMGTALEGMFAPDRDRVPTIYAVNLPESISKSAEAAGLSIVRIETGEVEVVLERITLRDADLCLVFPERFDELVDAYDVRAQTGAAPNIAMYYNSVEPNSFESYRGMVVLLDVYESSLANKFDINNGIDNADRATAEDMSASIISSMMPMLLMIFLYSGCVGLAPESIAGEKERGTIATLLVTPLKRSELAAGKIISLAVLSFLSGLVTAAATILSLPNLMGGGDEGFIDAGIYSAADYLMLAFVILTTILLIVALISIISAFAKTVKEAGTAVMPLMVVVMLVGVTGMFGGAREETVFYLIPLFNSVQSMSGVFSRDYSVANVAAACLSNLVYACIGGFALTKMFNSEKVMFTR